MAQDWQDLTRLTGPDPFMVERVKMVRTGIRIEGAFELPPLARLSAEDQVFVMAFVRCDGSIKDMEKSFGVSYPTIKSRLAKIAQQFQFVESGPASVKDEVLRLLEEGQISPAEAIERLSK